MASSRSTIGYVSKWYSSMDFTSFRNDAQPGDAIEFKRGSYCHWGIYVGEVKVDDKLKHCIVHASSPDHANSINVIASSGSLNKRANDLGVVQIQAVEDAAHGCNIRVNNSMDKDHPPHSPEKIVKRAFASIQEYDEYHLLKNNCEHFAHWCRNGVKKSCQVEQLFEQVVVTSAAVVAVLFSVVLGRNIFA